MTTKPGESKYGVQRLDRRAYMKAYWADPVNAERGRLTNLESRRQRRKQAEDILGGCCAHCGMTDRRCLQIDHKNNDGYAERKRDNQNWYRKMISRILAGEPGYQLLCANCNWIKRYEENEGPQSKLA